MQQKSKKELKSLAEKDIRQDSYILLFGFCNKHVKQPDEVEKVFFRIYTQHKKVLVPVILVTFYNHFGLLKQGLFYDIKMVESVDVASCVLLGLYRKGLDRKTLFQVDAIFRSGNLRSPL